MNVTYLTTEKLSARIKYDERTIRELLKDSALVQGTHLTRQDGSAIDPLLATRFASGSTSGAPLARPTDAANESPSPPTAQPPPERTGRRALLRLVA